MGKTVAGELINTVNLLYYRNRKEFGGKIMAVLTVNEFEFLRKLISIESTGDTPVPGKPY